MGLARSKEALGSVEMDDDMRDAIIIGGGHNGLTCAAYLARAGLKPLVLERRSVIGGASVTESPWPGYRVSTLSYVVSLLRPEIVRDLELARHGYRSFEVAPDYFVPFSDGRHLFVWADPQQTAEEFARFSQADARAYPAFDAHLAQLAKLLRPLLSVIPPRLGSRHPRDLADQLRFAWRMRRLGSTGIDELVRLMGQSVTDLLDDWFESDEVKAALVTQGVIGTYGAPSMPGTAYILLHHWMGELNGNLGSWGVVRGGMGSVADALASAARSHGAEIRTDAPVERIIVQDGRATGVRLASGEEIRARTVVSNAHPQLTFLRLVDSDQLSDGFLASIRRYRSRSGTVKINLAIGELPDFTALPGTTVGPQHRAAFEICPSIDYVERAFDDTKEGRASAAPYAEGIIPTVYDDSIAPTGKHQLQLFCQYVPASWAGEDHGAELEAFADRVIERLADLAPNLPGAIEHRQVIGPYEMEQEYGLIGGNIMHGELSLEQLFAWRPVPGWANHRSPIAGLYQCGSGTHPGGGVMGAPGRNAARVVLADRRARPRFPGSD
jgi:phytoene dehydrogenase-like protein